MDTGHGASVDDLVRARLVRRPATGPSCYVRQCVAILDTVLTPAPTKPQPGATNVV